MFIYRDKFSDDDDTPIIHPIRNISKRYNLIDSDNSDCKQTNDYEDDDEEYHTISDFNNSDSGKDYFVIKNVLSYGSMCNTII